jgi:VanZ family protein
VVVSIPLVLILGLIVFVAWRHMGLRAWQAVLCLVLGFLLAATTVAPEIRHAITAIVRWAEGSRS